MNSYVKKSAEISADNLVFDNPNIKNDLKFDRLVSPKTAAKLLEVNVKFIYECIARGEIKAERIGGRLRRIRLSILEAWLLCQRQRGM